MPISSWNEVPLKIIAWYAIDNLQQIFCFNIFIWYKLGSGGI